MTELQFFGIKTFLTGQEEIKSNTVLKKSNTVKTMTNNFEGGFRTV